MSVASMSLEQLMEAVGRRVRQELQTQCMSISQLPPVPVGKFLPVVVVVVIFKIRGSESIDRSRYPLACIFMCCKSFFVMACFQYMRNRKVVNFALSVTSLAVVIVVIIVVLTGLAPAYVHSL